MLLDSIPGVRKITEENHALYTLWEKYGKWESEGPQVFNIEHLVERQDLRASDGIVVPNICTVLRLSDEDRDEYGLQVSDILIRDEYLKSLGDICHFATQRAFPPENDTAEGGREDPIGFHNPFLDTEEDSMVCAVSLLGHSGIGKSLWVVFVLVLRILAGRPTIYNSELNLFYVFNKDGLYSIDPTNHSFLVAMHYFFKEISPKYWCLVDCNNTLRTVPEFLSRTRAFIVQAASPRSERIDWVKKYHSLAERYFMKNWSLPELIMGRALQLNGLSQCSEQSLEAFYFRYAPSPRMAYIYADNLESYERIVHTDVTRLTFETLGNMLSSAEALQVENVSHHILLVTPQNNHSDQSITIPTRYMYNILRDQLHIHTLEEAARLFQIFVRNQYTKGLAGYILDDIHNVFCNGGEWPLTRMTKDKPGPANTHFKSPESKGLLSLPLSTSLYMRVGYGDNHVTFAKHPLTQGAVFTRLVHHRFLRSQNIPRLENAYYQPAAGQLTFGGFIYDQCTQTAFMLQMTVGTHHDVKVEGLQWLINQGARKVHLVVVKPPSMSLDLAVPNNLTASIMDVHELVLESLESVQS